MQAPFISVIIPIVEWNPWVVECVTRCAELDYPDFDIWLAPNDPPDTELAERLNLLNRRGIIHVLPTGPGNPSRKRNALMKAIHADYMAFIDSDAYPHRHWLQQGVPLLMDDIAIVTGPNLTPPNEPLLRRIAGNVMQSRWGFGQAHIRHRRVPRRYVREMPTCNMIIKRDPGIWFHEELDTGEDMVLCEDYIRNGKRILYDPNVVVYHHRRKIFLPFIIQFFYYGYYKSRLFRQGSSIAYGWQALPALFVLYLAGLVVLSLALPQTLWLGVLYLPLLGYVIMIGIESFRAAHTIVEGILTVLAFVAGHIGYGGGYLLGYMQSHLTGFNKKKPLNHGDGK